MLVKYSIADYKNGTKNIRKHSLIVNISRNAMVKIIKANLPLEDEDKLEKIVIENIKEEVRNNIGNGNDLPGEIALTLYNNLLKNY